jgi:hypothetical protein
MLIRHKSVRISAVLRRETRKPFSANLHLQKKLELKKKNVQAVLIRVTRSRKTSPSAQDVQMRYNLEGESLIDGYAYEFDAPLEAGTIAQANGPGS